MASWKKKANAVLEKSTGLRLARADRGRQPGHGGAGPDHRPRGRARPPVHPETDRLLKAPVFILSTPRAGSTLLRVLLDSHSEICAPHESHFRRLRVLQNDTSAKAMAAFGHHTTDLEHLLWDRILHRELQLSGKSVAVEKTPSNVFNFRRIAACWPDARFLFLLRHPYAAALSWHEGAPESRPMSRAVPHVLKYAEAVERGRRALPGLTVRYERLTEDPVAETRRICEFLGLPWEEAMLDYGKGDQRAFTKGLGDWKDKIKTGSVQQGRALPEPEEVPEEMQAICRTWGYLGV